MMALRKEQPVELVEKIDGNPVIEEKRQEASSSADPVMQDKEETSTKSHGQRVGQTRAHARYVSFLVHALRFGQEDPHRRVATHEGRTLKVMLDWMFFTSDQEPGVQLHVLVVYDFSTGAVMAMQVHEGFIIGDSWCGCADT